MIIFFILTENRSFFAPANNVNEGDVKGNGPSSHHLFTSVSFPLPFGCGLSISGYRSQTNSVLENI